MTSHAHECHFRRADKNPNRPPLPSGKPGKPGTCDPCTAWWMMKCASVAYHDPDKIVRKMVDEATGFEEVTFFDTVETQGFLAYHPNDNNGDDNDALPFAVLAFRGTEANTLDLLTDISVIRRKDPGSGGEIHGGFLTAFKVAWECSQPAFPPSNMTINCDWGKGVKAAIEALPRPNDATLPVYFTGHSMGGALATLAALEALHINKIDVVGLYTFGMPQLGDKDFADHIDTKLENRFFRVVNAFDGGPRFPTLSGFKHPGGLIFLHRNYQAEDFDEVLDKIPSPCGFLFWVLMIIVGLPYLILRGTELLITGMYRIMGTKRDNETFWFEPCMTVDHRVIEYVKKIEMHLP